MDKNPVYLQVKPEFNRVGFTAENLKWKWNPTFEDQTLIQAGFIQHAEINQIVVSNNKTTVNINYHAITDHGTVIVPLSLVINQPLNKIKTTIMFARQQDIIIDEQTPVQGFAAQIFLAEDDAKFLSYFTLINNYIKAFTNGTTNEPGVFVLDNNARIILTPSK